MSLVQINKKDCLHCGSTESASYCEKCYQELISKNAELQEEQIKKVNALNRVIHIRDSYIEDLEYIRDCYYKEIAEREKNKKIFRLDKPDEPVSASEKMGVVINEIKKYKTTITEEELEKAFRDKEV